MTLLISNDDPNSTAAHRIRKYCTVNINFVPTFPGWSLLGLIWGRNSDCGGEVWLNSSTYVIACLTHNKLRLFTLTSLMFKCISIVPYIPSSGGKKVPICDSLIFLKLPNYIDEILQRVGQIRGYNKPRFLPDLRSNLAVP